MRLAEQKNSTVYIHPNKNYYKLSFTHTFDKITIKHKHKLYRNENSNFTPTLMSLFTKMRLSLEFMKDVQIDFNWLDPDWFCQWLYEHDQIS